MYFSPSAAVPLILTISGTVSFSRSSYSRCTARLPGKVTTDASKVFVSDAVPFAIVAVTRTSYESGPEYIGL